MTTALVSALAGIPVRRDVAMTGEVTLRGNVLPIGGLKEKTMAAYAAGVTTVCIPADNVGDLDEIDPIARENLTFIPCRRASEVLAAALVIPETAAAVKAPATQSPEALRRPEVTVRPATSL
jgi:ATP-dependent Lon protease